LVVGVYRKSGRDRPKIWKVVRNGRVFVGVVARGNGGTMGKTVQLNRPLANTKINI